MWNFDFFNLTTQSDIEKEKEKVFKLTNDFVEKYSSDKTHLKNSKALKIALEEYEDLICEAAKYPLFSSLQYLENQLNEDYQRLNADSDKFVVDLEAKIEFFLNELSKIRQSTQQKFLKNKSLANYHHFLERTFEHGKHVLSSPEEKILLMKKPYSYLNWANLTHRLTSKESREVLLEDGTRKVLNINEILPPLLYSSQGEVRESANAALSDIWNKYVDIAETEMNSIIGDKEIEDNLRGFSKPHEAKAMEDDVTVEFIDILLSSISSNYKISKRFYKVRAKMMGVEKIKYHDRAAEIKNLDMKFSFEESVEIIRNVLSKYSFVFVDIFNDLLNNGHISVEPTKGKYGGAFCAADTVKIKPYILLNYSNTLNDLLTLAHELGHAINFSLIAKNQTQLNFDLVTSTSEVASNFFEELVLKHIIETASNENQKYLILNHLDQDVASIFRQTAFEYFEFDLHLRHKEKSYVPAKEINELWKQNLESYLGDAVEVNETHINSWVDVSHFRNYFYCYSYVAGQLLAKVFIAKIEKSPEYINEVIKFLSNGSRKSPVAMLSEMNVNDVNKELWEEGLKYVEDELKRLEKLI